MKQTTHQVSYQSLLNHGNFSAGLYIKQGSSLGSLQHFLAIEPFPNFAFLRTDGDGTSPPPCSKFLSQYVCCRAVTDTLSPCFMHTEKRKVEKSSIPVSVSDVFLLFFFF